MKTTSTPRMAIGFAAAGVAAFGAYEILFHSWKNRWRATKEEIERPMPLDEVVRKPQHVTNRAVTIQAPPEAIWPWLSQMGELPRGGFYSYETIERLMGMKVENADRILPEFQNLRPGDVLDRSGTLVVKAVEPGRFLVLGPQGEPGLEITWALSLYPVDERSTRLVSRVRGWMAPSVESLVWRALLGPGQFIMERKMFLEIKRRAESMPGLKVAA
jgi:hypothetical protein